MGPSERYEAGESAVKKHLPLLPKGVSFSVRQHRTPGVVQVGVSFHAVTTFGFDIHQLLDLDDREQKRVLVCLFDSALSTLAKEAQELCYEVDGP
jgi:hypothetical protein